jgi:hypothetical protein
MTTERGRLAGRRQVRHLAYCGRGRVRVVFRHPGSIDGAPGCAAPSLFARVLDNSTIDDNDRVFAARPRAVALLPHAGTAHTHDWGRKVINNSSR